MISGCPIKTESYNQLEKLSGRFGALRSWIKYRKLGFEDADVEALKRFDLKVVSIEEKLNALADISNKVTPTDNHKYKIGDTILDSVSNKLDEYPDTAYRGEPGLQEFADSGTILHNIASLIANNVSETNIKQIMRDGNVPDNVYTNLKEFVDKLRETGVVVSEAVMASIESGVAGTSDLIHLKHDGTIDIYDFKSSFWTSYHRTNKKRPWNPVDSFGGYKARRYSAQLESYGRLIEATVGQPTTNKFIVPFEVEFNEDQPSKGFKSVQILDPENIDIYNKQEFASDIADRMFNQESRVIVTGALVSPDDSGGFLQELTGRIQGVVTNAEAQASRVNRGIRRGLEGYFVGKEFRVFKNQTDEAAKVQQIIDEHVAFRANSAHNIEYSIRNYIETGEDSYLDLPQVKSDDLKRVLSIFRNMQGTEVYNINRIKGFENKLNWIVVQQGNTYNLLYIGSDNLRQEFTVPLGHKNLFGNILSTYDATQQLENKLKNTMGDGRKLEGAMIAMKLKEAFPDARFDITSVYSVYDGGPYAEHFSLKEGLNVIRLMSKSPKVARIMPKDIATLARDEKFTDYKNYQQDFSKLIITYASQMTDHSINNEILEGVRDYSRDASNKQLLLSMISKEIDSRREIGKDIPVDYETRLLSALYFQIQGINIDLTPITNLSNLTSMPQNMGNDILQKVNVIVNGSINTLRTRFWEEYKDPFIKAQSQLFDAQNTPVLSWTRNVTLGDTSRYYNDLFKKESLKVRNEDGTEDTITLSVFEFPEEGSDQFNRLSKEQKDMIVLTNNVIEKYTVENRIQWVRGRLPLVKGNLSNLLANAMQKGDFGAYRNVLERAMDNLEDNFGGGDSRNMTSKNIFIGQSNTPVDDSRRKELLGITDDGYVDIQKYREWSSNLEVIMDVFAIQSLRYKAFNEAGAALKAAESIFQWSKSNLLIDRLGVNMDFAHWFNEYTVNNRDLDSGTTFNKVARAFQKVTSLTLIGANPMTALVAYLGQELTIFSQSLAGSVTKRGGFNTKNYIQSKAIVNKALLTLPVSSQEYDKINLLMDKSRLFNQDLSSLLNGYHRMGDKTLFRTKALFGMMSAGDWASRAHIMISKMLNDGTWEAYTVEDGVLRYDPEKDKRFGAGSIYSKEEQEALKSYLRNALGGGLTDAYDENFGNSIRAEANYLLGGFDRETRNGLNARAWGKFFMTFKNWLPAKIDRWLAKPHENQMLGKISFERDDKGELQAVWKGDQMEGIMYSMLAGIHYVKKSLQHMTGDKDALAERKPLSDIQKANLTRFASDLIMIGVSYLLYTNIPDDDDETLLDDYSALVIRRSVDDLLVMYNLIIADDFFWTPVSLQYINQTAQSIFRAVGDVEPERLLRIVPIARQVDYYYDIMNENEL